VRMAQLENGTSHKQNGIRGVFELLIPPPILDIQLKAPRSLGRIHRWLKPRKVPLDGADF
jgi:hypothetical protein